jgi:peptidyl-prolyl cis-trans isomerase SurA
LVILSLYTAIGRAGETLDGIVAIVNDDVVMQSELKRMADRVVTELTQRQGKVPPQRALLRQVLERLILMKIELQLAAQTGLRVDDDTLNRTVSNIAAENGLPLGQFREAVEQEGYSFALFREEVRNEIIVTRLRQREVDNQVQVSDREIENYLATQAQQHSDAEYRLSHILIASPEEATPEALASARSKADAVLKRLRSGEDFAAVAAAHSDGQQALDGGDLGWRKAAEVPSLFADAVRTLHEGEISDPIESPSGFHIIKLTAVRGGPGITMVKQTHARHILIKPTELIDAEEAQRRLKRLKGRVEAGEGFDDLARGHSDDKVTAAKGGDLGWVSPGDLVPRFEQAMEGLKPNELSDPFDTEFGWHIVQVLGRRERDNTEELIRSSAREAIRRRKLEEAREAWMRRLRDEAYVEYRLELE